MVKKNIKLVKRNGEGWRNKPIISKMTVGNTILKYRGLYAENKFDVERRKIQIKTRYPKCIVRFVPVIAKYEETKGKTFWKQYTSCM